jgi:CDP-glucose 4,6-dehydratase
VRVDPAFWHGRRVLLTGNTGFKGAWLALWLAELGADVHGFSDGVPTTPSLHELARIEELAPWTRADVRDPATVDAAVRDARPEVVIHMAAQPMVRRSFREPRETYETNVMGTVHVLDAVRRAEGVRVVVNVTSDKCYDNRELGRPFREDDPKGGHDPYSNSKGCAELVADAFLRSYFAPDPDGPRLGSGRAGNVIGGGDWGEDRLVPDIMRGALAGEPIRIRNPDAIRPWQHVLNPLSGYLVLAQALWEDASLAGGWNFGPEPGDAQPVRHLVERVAERWPRELEWSIDTGEHPHEAGTLLLDSGKAHERLGWAPAWGLDDGLDATVAWYAAHADGADMRATTLAQIAAFTAVRA